jgi:hypothetical protein
MIIRGIIPPFLGKGKGTPVIVGIDCDACHVQGDRGRNPTVMRRELKRLGWELVEDRDLCPRCATIVVV